MNLDLTLFKVIGFQQRHALTISKICLGLYVFNMAMVGFTAVAVPQMSTTFAYSSALFFTGAVSNFMLSRSRTKK